ncbi:MAG TPA: nuclear transport factor 2 family protein [Blastocatellia bacterium]|nr:nuclear transport factor 2 family protein [Blastocatellia bacterium]
MLGNRSRSYQRPKSLAGFMKASMLVLILVIVGVSQNNSPSGPKKQVVWDEAEAKELESQYHRLHDAWNALDVKALKRMIVGDEILASFDLDPDTNDPVKLTSKQEIDKFTDKIFEGFKKSGVKTLAQHPMIKCRATGELGICTEECRVQLIMPDGGKTVQLLRASAVAIRQPDGWRFIQWHMSAAGPAEKFDKDGRQQPTQ